MIKHLVWLFCLALLAGCGSMGGVSETKPEPPPAAQKATPEAVTAKPGAAKKGGYYLDDGPGDGPQPDFDAIPDAVPRYEPPLARANRPYVALGENYTPMTEFQPYKASGIASWYGKRYHGQKTSTGEVYDMYGMSAAHTTLPIPSFVRVTNPENGRSVIVRVNDRGPFKKDRLIDLSYAAAYKLHLTGKGSGLVEVEAIDARKPLPEPAQPALGLDKALEKPVSGGTFVQVGAFKQKDNADQLRARIVKSGLAQNGAVESWYNDGMHRVRLGPYVNRDEAERAALLLKQSLGLTAIVTLQ
ncbi:MAG TPA: septal ring lytic transglycosylase RlpA family protein [Novimethylophilus sp.]|jgi:rare lipoprotein A|uniref:septal ring lytic transglycosylase RlpA family protein n=1 Tax=Novimethylophilus sp. TaxID=2137426 RepID=UPI002F3FDD9E